MSGFISEREGDNVARVNSRRYAIAHFKAKFRNISLSNAESREREEERERESLASEIIFTVVCNFQPRDNLHFQRE